MASTSVQASVSSQVSEDGTVVVSVDGDVNVANGPDLGLRLLDVLGSPTSDVVVDLRGVTWIDPNVLRPLVLALRRVEARKHALVLVRPDPHIWRMCEAAGLGGALLSFGDLSGALGRPHDLVSGRFVPASARWGGDGWRPVSTLRSPAGDRDECASDAPAAVKLSARERRVLAELACGRTTEDAAAVIGVSPHTVRSHLRTASRKLGARTRTHAVALAIAQGSIPAGSV